VKKDYLARLMSEEMGKIYSSGIAEIEKCIWVCRFYARQGVEMLQDEPVETDARKSYVSYQPLGAVLGIMPWNFPFWQVFRFAIPAIMAGNTVLLKHASNVPACAMAIEKLFLEAGFAPGVFQTLLVGSGAVESCIAHPAVKAVSLTGSSDAGRKVAAIAGFHLKKCVLELGGSDPYIILKDADIPKAVKICVQARLVNAGQSCIAGKRFIVEEAVYETFRKMFVEAMSKIVLGYPMSDHTQLGPMASIALRDQLHYQVQRTIDMGAICETGGFIPPNTGAFYPATVLSDVKPGMPAYDEELFGPVAVLMKAKDETEAIQLANDNPYGLGAAIFSRDKEYAEQVAREMIDAGVCFVNEQVKTDPRLPFGGIKFSGYGRELSALGIREFVNAKTVYVA
jgi:succinate-semialdehyde dehydrogenase/glutarate-semialdehyde dehydrogenase